MINVCLGVTPAKSDTIEAQTQPDHETVWEDKCILHSAFVLVWLEPVFDMFL